MIDEREAFEAWWVRDVPESHRQFALQNLKQSRFGDGIYENERAQEAWKGWQARAAAPQAALSEAVKCPACGGNDANMPCAFPQGGQPGCPRDVRLGRVAAQPDERATFEREWGNLYGNEDRIFMRHHTITEQYVNADTQCGWRGWQAARAAAPQAALTDEQRDSVEYAQQVLRQVEAGDGTFVGQCTDAISGLDALLATAQGAQS